MYYRVVIKCDSAAVGIVTLPFRRREGPSAVGADQPVLHPLQQALGVVLVGAGRVHDDHLSEGDLRGQLLLDRLFEFDLLVLLGPLVQGRSIL
jgi:hypothetical protein